MRASTARPLSSPPFHAGGAGELVALDKDHPGFRDPAYRARRDAIARVALDYAGGEVPRVGYSAEEHAVWSRVWTELRDRHRRSACAELVAASDRLDLATDAVPQLADLNPRLRAATGFEMQPVAGLVNARTFLSHLGDRVFLSTQYIRHHSSPLYTPEPDIIHELIGHAASLMHPGIAELSRRMGVAARGADDAGVLRLERVYWYSLEFGVVMEDGGRRGFGAGVLSSIGELERACDSGSVRAWSVGDMAATDYDPTDYQPSYFAAPSFGGLLSSISDWLEREFAA